MGYVVVVLLQTLILPLGFGAFSFDSHAALDVLATFGRWFLFWGVGTRLALAGIVQVVRPDFTTSGILGESPAAVSLTTRELGFANVAMGAGAIVGTFVGGGLAAAVTGGAYMACAGFGHVGKSASKNTKETVATWTDLLIFAAMAVYVIALLAR
jgi:hypothetical protein